MDPQQGGYGSAAPAPPAAWHGAAAPMQLLAALSQQPGAGSSWPLPPGFVDERRVLAGGEEDWESLLLSSGGERSCPLLACALP
jgi:hypothetical protein